MISSSKLTLGPVLFNWKPEALRDFYFRMADEAAVDTVHVGEVVCSKRTPFFEPFIPEIIELLTAAGKEVVLSSLALIMTDRELAAARDLAAADLERDDIGLMGLRHDPMSESPSNVLMRDGFRCEVERSGDSTSHHPALGLTRE